jgi:hypothetical protein
LLCQPDEAKAIVEKNYEIAARHFSLEILENKLQQLLESF